MVDIPEQAVEAAIAVIRAHDNEAWGEDCGDEPYVDLVNRMLTAAAPYMSGVKVKQMEWTGAPNDAGRKGLWFIAIDHFGRQYEILKMFNGQKGEGWGYRSSWYPSLEAAKAAAQADYEKRILSALEPSSSREQALEEAAQIAELHEGEPCRPAIAWTDEERQFYASGQQDASSSIATAIRALKSQPAPQTGGAE